ncbi:MAG: LCP family protein [Actinomycetota bacterium]|nr:LCP family protein [Actinomycetota bacterium]
MTNASGQSANPGLAAVFSAVVPGAGQWYGGRLRRAIAVFVPVVVLVVVAASAWSRGRVRLLELVVQPSMLWTLLGVNLLVLAWREFAVVDAFRTARNGRRPGRLAGAVLAATVTVVALPHIVFVVYDLEAIDLLESVFVGDEVSAPVFVDESPPSDAPFAPGDNDLVVVPDPALIVAPKAASSRSTRNLIFRSGIGDPEAIEAWPEIIDDPVDAMGLMPPEDTAGIDQITILLAGGDGGPGRGGMRTDSIIVATFNTVTGRAALFGIPRNLVQIPLRADYDRAFDELQERITPWEERKQWTDDNGDGAPDQFASCHCFPDQINAIYPYTRKWTETYPDEIDPGMATLRDTVEILLGIDIDFYALVNMSGFVRVVDALGGVRTYVTGGVQAEVSPAREGEDWIEVNIRPGWNRLNGHEALAYVRERKTSNDYVRMRRQRCMLKSVAASADVVTIARRFTALSRAVKSSVRTDIPLDYVPTLISQAAALDFNDIVTVGFTPPEYAPTENHRNQPIPDLGAIRAKVQEILNADVGTVFETGQDTECRV